jgi:hypothetical protein
MCSKAACALWPNAAITIEAIIIAFVLTSLAILLAAPKDSYLSKFATHPGISSRLMRLHTQTILVGGAGCVLSLFVMVLCPMLSHYYQVILFSAWIYALSCSMLLLYRIVRVMQSILITP